MAFQLNTSITGHKSLLGLLETYLSAQGWTINDNTNAAERFLHVSKTKDSEEFFFELESTAVDNIRLRGVTADPATSDVSDWVYLNLSTGTMPKAWFFVGDLYCHIVVEVATGYFQHCGFGKLTPFYTYSSSNKEGSFVFGSIVREWNSVTNSLIQEYVSLYGTNSTTSNFRTIRCLKTDGVAWCRPPDAIRGGIINFAVVYYNETGDRILFPVNISLDNTPATVNDDRFSFGAIPSMAIFPDQNLTSGSTVTIGSDDWVLFPSPYVNKAVLDFTYPPGFAYKK